MTRTDAPRTDATPSSTANPATSTALADMDITDTLIERMEIELGEVDARRVTASMPVAGNTQPYGLLHGGASAVLAETVGSVAAATHAAGTGQERIAVGVELSCSHHRSARTGSVHAVAEAIHLGGSLATYDIRITDDEGRLVCTARLTCMIRDARA